MIFELVTIEEAKIHQRIVDTADDQDVQLKVRQASAIVMRFLKKTEIPDEWVETYSPAVYDIPFDVQSAVFLVFGELWENREAGIAKPLSQGVLDVLWALRDPTMA